MNEIKFVFNTEVERRREVFASKRGCSWRVCDSTKIAWLATRCEWRVASSGQKLAAASLLYARLKWSWPRRVAYLQHAAHWQLPSRKQASASHRWSGASGSADGGPPGEPSSWPACSHEVALQVVPLKSAANWATVREWYECIFSSWRLPINLAKTFHYCLFPIEVWRRG